MWVWAADSRTTDTPGYGVHSPFEWHCCTLEWR